MALLAAGCTSEETLDSGDAATVGEGSVAEFSLDGDDWVERVAGETIPAEAQVRSVRGVLRLAFRDGAVRLSPDAVAAVATDRVALERGEALVRSTGALRAAVEDTVVSGSGLYRVAGGLASRVGVYHGTVDVRRPAQDQMVTALRELDLTPFRLGSAEPLQYSDDDPWDQEFLGDAIAFDGEAARLTSGLNSQLGLSVRRPVFYRRIVGRPGVLPLLSGMADQVRGSSFGPPSDVLLPLFIAQAGRGALESSLMTVEGLRDRGARWGLIARELDVQAGRVVAAIDRLGRQQLAASRRARLQRRRARAEDVQTAALDTTPPAPVVDSTGGSGDSQNTGGSSSNNDPPKDSGGSGGDDPAPKPPAEEPPKPPGGGGGEPKPPPDPPDEPVSEVVTGIVNAIDKGADGIGLDKDRLVPRMLKSKGKRNK